MKLMELWVVILLYFVAALVLLAEIFIPSHGLLSVLGVGFLVAAIASTFFYAGREAGVIALLVSMVTLPALALLAVKLWPKTPMGRRIAPANPVLTAEHLGVPVKELSMLVGKTGRTLSPLRPVGVCDFDGRRVSCITRFGMIDAGVGVEGVGIEGGNLAVVERHA